jgi:uncharacterized protein YktB (UPF0637 family)
MALLNSSKPKFAYIIFKNSVRTVKKSPHFTIIKFKEVIAVYSVSHVKPVHTQC